MLVIKVNVWPQGDWQDPQEVASLELTNLTGVTEVADYSVLLRPENRHVTVYGHRRVDGWLPLARAALRAADPGGGFYTSPDTQVPADVLAVLPLAPYVSRACQTARAILAAGIELDGLLAAGGLERQAWAAEFFRSCRVTEKWTGMRCQDPHHAQDPPAADSGRHALSGCPNEGEASDPEDTPDLTREELQGLVDELGLDLYRAQDLLAYIGEMCDAADRDGTAVTAGRVRGWLAYTGCGGVLTLPKAVTAALREQNAKDVPKPVNDQAASVGASTWTVTTTVTAPTPDDAERWAHGIGSMVLAEFGDSMRLNVLVAPWAPQLAVMRQESARGAVAIAWDPPVAPASVAEAATGEERRDIPLADWERELLDGPQPGVPTPGCDCGHEGMGASWHRDDCTWKTGPR